MLRAVFDSLDSRGIRFELTQMHRRRGNLICYRKQDRAFLVGLLPPEIASPAYVKDTPGG